jgi:hypothetical protein
MSRLVVLASGQYLLAIGIALGIAWDAGLVRLLDLYDACHRKIRCPFCAKTQTFRDIAAHLDGSHPGPATARESRP